MPLLSNNPSKTFLTFLFIALAGCSDLKETHNPEPPMIPEGTVVFFRYGALEDSREGYYELPQDQARLLIRLLNSTPTVSHDAADWYMEAADPI